MNNKKKIAVVIPVFREEKSLVRLYQRLVNVCGKFDVYSWEYVFVNDGSPDGSLNVLKSLAEHDTKVKVIDLSRNFGKEIALTAGVHEVEDVDAVICIDGDLQHPPELIPELISRWESGIEIVATIRIKTEKETLLRKIGSRIFYLIMKKISGIEVVSQSTDFRLYDKKVINAFKHATERERLFRGIMDWMGFKREYVEFTAAERTEGASGYSYKKLIGLAINSITAFSLWPLRLTGYFGVLISGMSAITFLWMLSNYILQSEWVYTPLAMAVVINTFLIGVVLMAIGLVALYVGTIHTEVINRPLYVVREKLNF